MYGYGYTWFFAKLVKPSGDCNIGYKTRHTDTLGWKLSALVAVAQLQIGIQH